MLFPLRFSAFLLLFPAWTTAFPEYESLAGLSNEAIELFIRESKSLPGAQPAPGPLNDTSSKLVNDAAHPFRAPGRNDLRGPCPGLNTLASHGVGQISIDTKSMFDNNLQ